MSQNTTETLVGAAILIVTALSLLIAYNSSSEANAVSGGYPLFAKFSSIEGIRVGSDVRISGIKVGEVASETLNPSTYLAVVRLSIDPAIKLPDDTTAEIRSSLLLGHAHIALVPGSSGPLLQSGGEIKYTRPPVSLEDLIGKYIFNPG